jgi:ATP-dependent Clp protease ATP-binding subunit ClpA
VRKALADELLFGRLAHGGSVMVDIDEDGKVKLDIQSSNQPPSKSSKASIEPVEEI